MQPEDGSLDHEEHFWEAPELADLRWQLKDVLGMRLTGKHLLMVSVFALRLFQIEESC